MPLGSRSQLPQELIDQVIDYLYHDQEALHACTLVCKAWGASGSFHLFSSFSWPRCAPGSRVMCPEDHKAEKTLSMCLQLLSSRSRIRKAVREFEIREHSATCSGVEPEHHASWSVGQLFRILELMPRLHTLRLRRCRFIQPPSFDAISLTRGVRLRHMCLDCGSGSERVDLSMLLNIVTKLHHVSSLEIRCLFPQPPSLSDTPAIIPEPLVDVECLSIRCSGEFIGGLLSRIETLLNPASIKSFTIPVTDLTPQVTSFVRHLPNLKSIYFRARRNHPPSCLTHLQLDHLELSNSHIIWTAPDDQMGTGNICHWDDLLRNLEDLACTNAKVIDIHLDLQEYCVPPPDAQKVLAESVLFLSLRDWEELGRILQQYASLQSLCIRIKTRFSHVDKVIEAVEGLALDRLPERIIPLLRVTAEAEHRAFGPLLPLRRIN